MVQIEPKLSPGPSSNVLTAGFFPVPCLWHRKKARCCMAEAPRSRISPEWSTGGSFDGPDRTGEHPDHFPETPNRPAMRVVYIYIVFFRIYLAFDCHFPRENRAKTGDAKYIYIYIVGFLPEAGHVSEANQKERDIYIYIYIWGGIFPFCPWKQMEKRKVYLYMFGVFSYIFSVRLPFSTWK